MDSFEVSVVIPHFYSTRDENLKGLLEDLKSQSLQAMEILIIESVSPQGRAINEGARKAKGEIVELMEKVTDSDLPGYFIGFLRFTFLDRSGL